jgi:hypothetical protein
MHHAAGNHSAKPHLHHAARQPHISQRLGRGGRSSGHRRGQPHPMVDLSRKRAPVDQIARRAALSNYHAERTRTRGDVSCLPVNFPRPPSYARPGKIGAANLRKPAAINRGPVQLAACLSITALSNRSIGTPSCPSALDASIQPVSPACGPSMICRLRSKPSSLVGS